MMRTIYFSLIILLFACAHKTLQPAENALDAAREFKTACLNGEFETALFYTSKTEKSKATVEQLKEKYSNISSEEKEAFIKTSLQIHQVKALTNTTTQIILSASNTKVKDTLLVVQQNNMWVVDLQ